MSNFNTHYTKPSSTTDSTTASSSGRDRNVVVVSGNSHTQNQQHTAVVGMAEGMIPLSIGLTCGLSVLALVVASFIWRRRLLLIVSKFKRNPEDKSTTEEVAETETQTNEADDDYIPTGMLAVDTKASPRTSDNLLALSGEGDDGQVYAFELRMEHFPVTIGRSRSLSDFTLPHESISRSHIEIGKSQKGPTVEDLGSSNGTYVNGKRLRAGKKIGIKSGDRLRLGRVELMAKVN